MKRNAEAGATAAQQAGQQASTLGNVARVGVSAVGGGTAGLKTAPVALGAKAYGDYEDPNDRFAREQFNRGRR